MAIQVVHAFENHHHTVCTSKNDAHFHDNSDLDCSQLHYQHQIFHTEITSDYEVVPQHYYVEKFIQQPQQTKVVYLSKKSSRAPPYFTI
ncbi:hypothetical protein [Tenacibaculum sp. IB213877]|uniref:hypothetical protein n=1 Tax=Tenacibaculum sp. IB213877 TaxID=3097351 RepID=UPI002A599439|nr:hypothetical protein [Tenacibaculum sp. IB213877]MDY0779415.1 hypothetical protein [Tenacibaculum sp. IB213877]